ncbi:MAG: TIGR01777 family oxidoreductase [Desulfatibacillaceae bacterium]|nr:TIGR01777 family oxidoreductase [Desulfatibacillaceae bacterium]
MRVLITGGLGFVGRLLTRRFLEEGHHVTAVDLPPAAPKTSGDYSYISADTTLPGQWQKALSNQDAAINLAGASIFRRWNPSYKKLIYNSRIKTTANLVDALPSGPGHTLISTSATGYYGPCKDEILTEDSPNGSKDFLAKVCHDWEEQAQKAADKGVRVAIARFGVVLGASGGALAQMKRPFSLGIGGPLGSGRQWFSWICEDDLAKAMEFILADNNLSGVFNFCAEPVTNRQLTKTLGKVLGRPAILPAPSFALRLFLGEFAGVLLGSQRAVAHNLLENGFEFDYPNLEAALLHLLKNGQLK